MARSVPIRHWDVDTSSWQFSFKVARGIHVHIGSTSFHFNPSTIWRVMVNPPKWLLVGGSWNIPTSFISIFITKILHRKSSRIILWAEANRYSMVRKSGLTFFVRRLLAKTVDIFAVPGELAADTIKNEWGVQAAEFKWLPNLIDENKFNAVKKDIVKPSIVALKEKDNIDFCSNIILLWPARLHENTKGILNFLMPLKENLPDSNVKILIAGEGPDGESIKKWVRENLAGSVILIGQKSEAEMLELYSIADVLLLPSIRDPNPLSVIEGLWSSLPLFISTHCGNQLEAVKEGYNGWIVEPNSSSSICNAFNSLCTTSKKELEIYGCNSLSIARKKFNSDVAIKKFFDSVPVE
ncbi:MAG TPA: glycosyltransferase [Ignavibacteria bacterium]|nr:glycosyltransferase [Ignavibacteria bacterium]